MKKKKRKANIKKKECGLNIVKAPGFNFQSVEFGAGENFRGHEPQPFLLTRKLKPREGKCLT